MKTACSKKILRCGSKPTKHKQIKSKMTIFLKRKISRLKKTGPNQIRNQNLCRPTRIR